MVLKAVKDSAFKELQFAITHGNVEQKLSNSDSFEYWRCFVNHAMPEQSKQLKPVTLWYEEDAKETASILFDN